MTLYANSWPVVRQRIRAVEQSPVALAYWESDAPAAEIKAHLSVVGRVSKIAGPGRVVGLACFLCAGPIEIRHREGVRAMLFDNPMQVPVCDGCGGYNGNRPLSRLTAEDRKRYRKAWVDRDPVHRRLYYAERTR